MLAINGGGALMMYRGNGAGRFVAGPTRRSARLGLVHGPARHRLERRRPPDLLARKSDGGLLMYRGNARGGFSTGTGETIGSGWGGFTALLAPGDCSGDGRPDILARSPTARC